MNNARKQQISTPPPRGVVLSLRRGETVNLDELMEWYKNDAPSWIREARIPADLAVFIWNLPDPKRWNSLQMVFRKD